MRKVDRSAIVPFPASTVFDIVDDVAAYHEFLPWCTASEEHSRSEDAVEATVELQKGALRRSFRTRNRRRPHEAIDLSTARDMIRYTPRSNFFDVMAAQLNGPEAEGVELTINFNFTDLEENHVLSIKNSVLNHWQKEPDPDADVTINITHELFLDMALGKTGLRDLIFSDQLSIDGNRLDLMKFFSLQDKSDGKFAVIQP